ncbi:MAG TPA: cytochrome c, partial [Candidatus Sulfotelmatobacter sp.]|nr:cytochrome c [Candidatus Sulfotelmatobacter sp.]
MKKFILGLIIGLLLPVLGGYLYIKMGMMPVATSSAALPMEEKIAHMALHARMAKEAPKDSPV